MRKQIEKQMQKQCEKLLDNLRIKYIHIPDNLNFFLRTKNVSPQLAKECSKQFKSVPDLLIFAPAEKHNICLQLELKAPGGTPDKGQIEFAKILNVVTVYNIKDAINEILKFKKEYLK